MCCGRGDARRPRDGQQIKLSIRTAAATAGSNPRLTHVFVSGGPDLRLGRGDPPSRLANSQTRNDDRDRLDRERLGRQRVRASVRDLRADWRGSRHTLGAMLETRLQHTTTVDDRAEVRPRPVAPDPLPTRCGGFPASRRSIWPTLRASAIGHPRATRPRPDPASGNREAGTHDLAAGAHPACRGNAGVRPRAASPSRRTDFPPSIRT